jgi:hypothetical protein
MSEQFDYSQYRAANIENWREIWADIQDRCNHPCVVSSIELADIAVFLNLVTQTGINGGTVEYRNALARAPLLASILMRRLGLWGAQRKLSLAGAIVAKAEGRLKHSLKHTPAEAMARC